MTVTRVPHQRSALGVALTAALLVSWPAVTGAAAAAPLTAADVARLRSVGEVAIAPDGTAIAYTLEVPRRPFVDEDGPAWSELWVISGEARPYVAGEAEVSALAWRPGRREISFLAKREGDETKSLYVIPVGGGEARRLLARETDIEAYSWAPDGDRVAFLAKEELSEEREELEEHGFTQQVFEEDWQPVRVWIASVAAAPEGAAGEAETSPAEPRPLDLPGSASELHWSPAGERLVVALAPTPLVDDGYVARRIHVIGLDSDAGADSGPGEILARIDNPGKLGEVAWSPDGRHLAFVSGADRHDPQQGRLMVVPADGGELRDLLPGFAGHVTDLAWLDEQTLAFLTAEGVWATLSMISLSASEPAVLLPSGGPIWTDLSVAAAGGGLPDAGAELPGASGSLPDAGGGLALIGATPAHPGEVFRLAGPGGPPPPGAPADLERAERLTDSNPWLAEAALGPQEVVEYPARDGLPLQGILIRPVAPAGAGAPHPLVLVVHGGPESHFANGWLTSYSRPGQVLAGMGFAVFYPNYRGSTGRGVEFSKLSRGDPAGKEFGDVVDAADHLIAAGVADPARIGVTGGSYGGYATAWLSTRHSERFAAGVMAVGISNEISKMGTTDIPWEMHDVHMGFWPWERRWEFLLERSPIRHVENARTPLLLLHGADDTRVHPSQSLQLYRYLKILDRAPVRLVLYPGEEHGNRKAAARLDLSLRLLRWMEHYLQGPGGEPPPYELDYPRPDTAAAMEEERMIEEEELEDEEVDVAPDRETEPPPEERREKLPDPPPLTHEGLRR